MPDGDVPASIARTLVDEKLAACANLVPNVRSIYRWKGKVCDDAEVLAIIKTTEDRFDALRARLIELHPYDCPEVVAVRVAAGHDDYLRWVVEQTRD